MLILHVCASNATQYVVYTQPREDVGLYILSILAIFQATRSCVVGGMGNCTHARYVIKQYRYRNVHYYKHGRLFNKRSPTIGMLLKLGTFHTVKHSIAQHVDDCLRRR